MQSKGKIVYIGGFELPDKNAAAHRVIGIGKIFNKLDYEVFYIGIHKSKEEPKYGNSNYRSIQYPNSKLSWIKYLFDENIYINFLNSINNVKMVILYNFPSFVSLKLLKYCRKNNIKCVCDLTEWYHVSTNNFIFNFIKNIDSNLRMKLISKKMDGLIVISSYLYNYYNLNNNIILIPPLIDLNDKKYEFNSIKTNRSCINFLYTGNPGKKDKLDTIINVLNKCNIQYKFSIIGITKEQFINIYNDHSIMLNDDIIFYGRVTHDKSLELLKKSDALIFYRDNTIVSKAGFSTKYVEATSCGVPSIVNLTSDLNDYIIDNYNGIVLSDNEIDNIEKINLLSVEKLYNLRKNIDRNTFDFNNYVNTVKLWLNDILK